MSIEAQIRLETGVESVAEARSFVRRVLGERLPNETLNEIVLVVSELVANAVRHVGLPVDLTIHSDGVVRVEVADPSAARPARLPPTTSDISGRGLNIVHHICDRWGTHVLSGGKCVWCEVDVRADPHP